MKYRIKGTYVMTLYVDVDEVVEAPSEDEAIFTVIGHISDDDAEREDGSWYNCGPDVEVIES